MGEESKSDAAEITKSTTKTTESPEHPSPAFQEAINRFVANSATTTEPKQETETPEINAVERVNDYRRIVSNIVKLKFLPSKPDSQELTEIETYSQHFPINKPGLLSRIAPKDIFHALKRATRPSKDGNIVRSLSTRAIRAKIYKELKSIPKGDTETRQKLIEEANIRDKIARDFLNQQEITVDIDGLGEQMARFVVLEPQETAGKIEQPPIFHIPGISNDLDSVAGLAQEAAYSGRKIITVAFPDARLGRATAAFAKAVQDSPHFEPHTTFYQAAIDKLIPEGEFELWGFSTGGPIAAEILNNPKYQQRVKNAVLIAPASTQDQSVNFSLMPGLGHEMFGLKNTIERYSFILGGKNRIVPIEDDDARKAASSALIEKVAKGMPDLFQGARVQEGGKIIVISQEKDDVTKTEKAKSVFANNPQMEVTTLENAYHNTAVTEPERVIKRLHKLQNF